MAVQSSRLDIGDWRSTKISKHYFYEYLIRSCNWRNGCLLIQYHSFAASYTVWFTDCDASTVYKIGDAILEQETESAASYHQQVIASQLCNEMGICQFGIWEKCKSASFHHFTKRQICNNVDISNPDSDGWLVMISDDWWGLKTWK